MKILVVGNLYPPVVFGGYEILCRQVVEKLQARGHQVEVVCSRHGADRAPWEAGVERTLHLTTDFPAPGQRVDQVDFHPASLARISRINRRLLAPVMDRFRPELVFAWCLNRLGLAALSLAQQRSIACCYTLNDEHPRQFRPSPGQGLKARFKRWLERSLWKGSTLASLRPFPVTAISYALRDRLLAQGVPIAHARIIHQGIPLHNFPFQPLAREPGQRLRVLYVGQLSRNKGCHTLLQAFQDPALASQAELKLVGDGVPDYEEHLKALAAHTPHPERIQFSGRLPHAEVAEQYRNHHVLVFPSEWEEPFGLTHLEAMASGCAVCSTTTGGSKELIRHEQNGLAYSAGEVSQLIFCLLRLEQDEELRLQLIQGGRQWVETHHSLESYVSRLESFLQACLKL
jgi:glycogen(starch) synthase